MKERNALLSAMKEKNVLVLYRDDLPGEEFSGVPVSVEDELTVLHRQQDFRLDGYAALRTGDITMAEQMDDLPFCRRAFEGERVYEGVKVLPFSCGNWDSLFEGIARHCGGWLSVRVENESDPLFFVGRLKSHDGRYLTMRCVGADGQWYPETATLSFSEITEVSFGDRYLGVFKKYCKE